MFDLVWMMAKRVCLPKYNLVYYAEDVLTKEYYFKYDESDCLEQLTRFKTGMSEK